MVLYREYVTEILKKKAKEKRKKAIMLFEQKVTENQNLLKIEGLPRGHRVKPFSSTKSFRNINLTIFNQKISMHFIKYWTLQKTLGQGD